MVSLQFFTDIILPAALWPEVDSASKRNEYQGHLLGGKRGRSEELINSTPSCANCIEIWELKPPGNLRGLSRCVEGMLYRYLDLYLYLYLYLYLL